MAVFVISKYGERLMPTTCYGKVRHMLKDGRAVIFKRDPFTIQLTYDSPSYTQPIELCMDTGYEHIGLSLKSESEEYVANQYDLLPNEKQRHDDQRKLRRTRRNRLRYRKPRFSNRHASKKPGWFAPSLKNRADRHIDLIARYSSVCPITSIYLEVGEFDTMLLKALQEGKSIPTGTDYQHGPKYGTQTLRSAVFARDKHTCKICGRGLADGAVLHAHHMYFWRGQHGDSMDELITVCEKCHTSENHKPGGKLWSLDKKVGWYTGAAFMNTVRWYIYERAKSLLPDVETHITYGAATHVSRTDLGLEKSHTNDAYSMGRYHPTKRADAITYKKRRRNNRILEKFYDAKYLDTRDGKVKSGAQLGCQRTNRREARNSSKNLRIYHGPKKAAGRRSIRRKRYNIQPGDVFIYHGKKYISNGVQHYGEYVTCKVNKETLSFPVKKIHVIHHAGGWQ